jgi:hypothetical protein
MERFAVAEDLEWFESTIKNIIEADFGERVTEHVTITKYFVDFMRLISNH